MPVASFSESHKEQVLSLRDVTFAGMNLSRFVWEPCQQVESLDKQAIRFVFEDGDVRGYGAAYQLDATHFRLNLIVDQRHSKQGIGSQLLQRIEEEVVRMKGKYLQARVLEAMPTSLNFALTEVLCGSTSCVGCHFAPLISRLANGNNWGKTWLLEVLC